MSSQLEKEVQAIIEQFEVSFSASLSPVRVYVYRGIENRTLDIRVGLMKVMSSSMNDSLIMGYSIL